MNIRSIQRHSHTYIYKTKIHTHIYKTKIHTHTYIYIYKTKIYTHTYNMHTNKHTQFQTTSVNIIQVRQLLSTFFQTPSHQSDGKKIIYKARKFLSSFPMQLFSVVLAVHLNMIVSITANTSTKSKLHLWRIKLCTHPKTTGSPSSNAKNIYCKSEQVASQSVSFL